MSDHKRCTSCDIVFEIDFMLKDDTGKWICVYCEREEDIAREAFWAQMPVEF